MAFTLFIWWLALAALGLAGWGLLALLGWREEAALAAWARPVGLLALGWATWLLGHVLPVPVALALVGGALLLGGACAGWRARARLHAALLAHWRMLLLGELLLLAVAAWTVWMRGRAPGIAHTEQPMDMAFLASCARAVQMPPADPWLAGEPLSYYYLGYLIWALLARLTGTAPTVAYNLALAATAGLAAQALYGLLWRLLPVRGRWARALGAVFGAGAIMAAGNLLMLAESLQALGALPATVAAWLGVPGLAEAPVTGSPLPGGNAWWRATRPWLDAALPGRNSTIIVEFPAFSMALGDLHPHLMALPFAVAAAGLALADGAVRGRWLRGRWLRAPVLGWAIGGVAFVNGWELPTLLLLAALWQFWCARAGKVGWRTAVALIGVGVAAALLPYLPFWAALDSQASGLQVAWFAKTPLHSYLLVFGAWLLPVAAWLLAARCPARQLWRWWLGWLVLPMVAVLLVGGVGRLALSVASLAQGAALGLALSFLLAAIAGRLWRRPAEDEVAPLLLALLGLGLAYACEALFLGDLFGTRMNTIFKFYYQAWWLLGVAAVVAVAALLRRSGWQRAVGWTTLTLWALLAGYPLLTAPAQTASWSLDAAVRATGVGATAVKATDDAAAVAWLREHAAAADVLLAAPGVDYDVNTARLATLSGVPTVLGWPQHEQQWGRDAELLTARQRDIATAYRTSDGAELRLLLRRYGVTLVLLGPTERALYGDEAVAPGRWAPWCLPAYAAGELELLRCAP